MDCTNRLVAFSAGLTMILASGTGVFAQENVVGADAYRTSCAVCHGSDGKGYGEFADVLTVKPSDLTVLAKNNDGVFPYLYVFQTVDGRAVIPAHGSRVMPIWGSSFTREIGESAGPFGAELLIRAKIVALADYVESLQQE